MFINILKSQNVNIFVYIFYRSIVGIFLFICLPLFRLVFVVVFLFTCLPFLTLLFVVTSSSDVICKQDCLLHCFFCGSYLFWHFYFSSEFFSEVSDIFVRINTTVSVLLWSIGACVSFEIIFNYSIQTSIIQ